MVWRQPECSLLIVLIAERWQVTVKSVSHFGGVDLILVATSQGGELKTAWLGSCSVHFQVFLRSYQHLWFSLATRHFCHLSIPCICIAHYLNSIYTVDKSLQIESLQKLCGLWSMLCMLKLDDIPCQDLPDWPRAGYGGDEIKRMRRSITQVELNSKLRIVPWPWPILFQDVPSGLGKTTATCR